MRERPPEVITGGDTPGFGSHLSFSSPKDTPLERFKLENKGFSPPTMADRTECGTEDGSWDSFFVAEEAT